jgi:hypothetical protein
MQEEWRKTLAPLLCRYLNCPAMNELYCRRPYLVCLVDYYGLVDDEKLTRHHYPLDVSRLNKSQSNGGRHYECRLCRASNFGVA